MGIGDRLKKMFKNRDEKDSEKIPQTYESQKIQKNSETTPKSIMFVCEYNDDVSPISEALFRNLTIDDVEVSSAAFNELWTKTGLNNTALEINETYNLNMTPFYRTELKYVDISSKDLILTATVSEKNSLKSKHPDSNIYTMKEYGKMNPGDITRNTIYGGANALFFEIINTLLKIIENGPFSLNTEYMDEIKKIYYQNREEVKGFKLLKNLIEDGDEIILDDDFMLYPGESEFSNGIDINANIVIDGNGHLIDAKAMAKIFNINTEHVTFKNIRFENVYSNDGCLIVPKSKTCEFENCTFTGNEGPALYIEEDASANLNDCTFKDNKSYAIFIEENAAVKIERCHFNSNYCAVINKTELTLTDCIFKNNRRTDGGDDYIFNAEGGGAILNYNSLILNSCSFKNNSAWIGGAVHNHSKATFNDCCFEKNTAELTGGSHAESQNYCGGAISHEGGKLVMNDCEFKNNTSSDGGAIKNQGEIELNRCNFDKNYAQNNGGAVFNSKGKMKMNDCNFNLNTAWVNGGAIINCSELTVKRADFKANTSEYGKGGAIYTKNYLTLIRTNLLKNTSRYGGGALYNDSVSCFIFKCEFTNNKSKSGSAILNRSNLNMEKCKLTDNENGPVIYQEFPINSVTVENSTFTSLTNGEMVYVRDGFSEITDTIFDIENTDDYWFSNAGGTLTLKNPQMPVIERKIIYNNNVAMINRKYKNFVENTPHSKLYTFEDEYDEDKGFAYLDKLICSESNEIKLDKDILLYSDEAKFYEGGVEIGKDGVTFDGQNHSIDAGGFSRVFYITGSDITLKNIRFKNGKYVRHHDDDDTKGGGAIHCIHNTSLKLINCEFENNESMLSGGAINNDGDKLTIIDSDFKGNESKKGTVNSNHGHLELRNCNFTENTGSDGVAIYDDSSSNSNNPTEIIECNFKNNRIFYEGSGGSIYSKVPANIIRCNFIENYADWGGAIYNYSEMKIYDSVFEGNESHLSGGAIDTQYGRLELSGCIFKNNISKEGSIYLNTYTHGPIERIITKVTDCEFINENGNSIIENNILTMMVKNICDSDELKRIVLNNKEWSVRNAVCENPDFDDEKTLIHVALNDDFWRVRESAIKNPHLNDAETFMAVSRNDSDESVRKSALNRLREIRPDMITGADDVSGTDDKNELINIIKTGIDPEVRIIAINRIDDEDIMIETVDNDSDTQVKCAALKKIDNQEILKNYAYNLEDGEARAYAISIIKDESVLKDIALNESDYDYRQAAAENPNLKDKEVLKRIICDDDDYDVRSAAARNPNQDRDILISIALYGSDSEYSPIMFGSLHVQMAAISNIDDADVLEEIVENEKNEDVVKVAQERLDELN